MATKPKPRLRRENAYFGIHIDLHPHDKDTELGRHVNEALVKRMIAAARPDYIQYDCKGHVGFLGYPNSNISDVAGIDQGKGIINDSLAIYRKVTAQHGVALFVHFSGVWDNVALRHHPQWAPLNPEGKPYGQQGQFVTGGTSTFSPYVTQHMIPQMKEVVDRYNVDGFWVDGDGWAVWPDYCPAAREKFKQLTGSDNPPLKPGDPLWLEWMTMHRDQFFTYVKTYTDAMHAYQPGLQIASNWLYSAMSPEPVKLPMDFISGDYSANDSVNAARFFGRQMANVGLPWDLMAWAFSLCNGNHAAKPAVQLQQEAAAVLALGGGFQFYFNPDRHGGFPDSAIRVMKEVADFCHPRRAVCHKTQPVPQVALLLDTNTVFRQAPGVYNLGWAGEYKAIQGMLHLLLEAGHSTDILCDHQLPWQQDHWPVIAVPEWELIPVGVVNELLQYVERGGNLLLTGAKTCGLFKHALGVQFAGEPTEATRHLQTKTPQHRLPNSVAIKGLWQQVSLPKHSSAKVVGIASTDRCGFNDPQTAATLCSHGKGQILAIYAPIGSNHLVTHTPSLREWMDDLLLKLYKPKVRIDQRGFDVVVRTLNDKLIVHLNHVAFMSTSPEAYTVLDQLPTSPPVTVTIRTRARPKRVTLQPDARKLPFTWKQGKTTVTLKAGVYIHQAIVVE